MVNAIQQHINGQLVDGKSGRKSPVFNPATGEQSGEINLANTAQVNEAIAIAKKAFPAWANTTPLRRSRILNKFLRIAEDPRRRVGCRHHR